MTRPGLRPQVLLFALFALCHAPLADANATVKPSASEAARQKASAKPSAKPQSKSTSGKTPAGAKAQGQTKTATSQPKAASGARTSHKAPTRAASTKRKSPAATRDGDLAAADGIVETDCYRLTRGRGRCEPQCLPYTRCRSGIASCRTGHENGPVTWFNCEQARGNTSLSPADGRVLVLGRNPHNMSTGHTLYVEKAESRGDGRYDLVLSHTNYDRRCNLETNMRAEYDPIAKTIDVRSGKWEQWGRDLNVAGFIHN